MHPGRVRVVKDYLTTELTKNLGRLRLRSAALLCYPGVLETTVSGWRTTKDVMDLRDEIVAKLDDALPEVRRHAWYWISFHMDIQHELQERNCGTPLDDEAIEWLRTQPARHERHKEVKTRLVESLEKRLEQARHELHRLG